MRRSLQRHALDGPDVVRGGIRELRGIGSAVLRPATLVPLVLGLALLAALLAYGDPRRVLALLHAFRTRDLLVIVAVRVAYEGAQYVQWTLLLRAVGLRIAGRTRAFAYFVGAVARVLPVGNYFGNYLLLQEAGVDFGRSAAPTTFGVLLEVASCLVVLALLGLGDWGWLRPLIVVGLATFLPTAWAVGRRWGAGSAPAWLTGRRRLHAAWAEVEQFRTGAIALWRPAPLALAGALGAGYVLLGGTTLYLVVVDGLDLPTITWPAALAVYCFSVAVALIVPLPIDLGVYEVGGVGAFLAIGVEKGDAVVAMLVMRALSSGIAALLALAAAALWPDQLRAALRGQPRPAPTRLE